MTTRTVVGVPRSQGGLIVVGLACIVLATGPVAADAPGDSTIHLLRGNITPGAVGPEGVTVPVVADPGRGDDGKVRVLVQFARIPSAADRAQFTKAGVALHDYIPERSWIASLPAAALPALARLEMVRFLKLWEPEDKVHPHLAAGEIGPWAVDEKTGLVNLFLYLHKDVPLDRGAELIRQTEGLAVEPWESAHSWSCWVPRESISRLAQAAEVYWIEEYPPPLTPTNDGARANMSVNTVAAAPYNLTGSGINVFVFDAGRALTGHEQLTAKITSVDSAAFSDHATHVAGTVAGKGTGTTQPRAMGMAPGAWLLTAGYSPGSGMLFYDSYGDMITDYSAARNSAGRNANMATNSIGSNVAANNFNCNTYGMYGASSRMIDRIVRGDETGIVGTYSRYIVTWAAGNERTSGTPWGRCGGGFNTLGPPSSAKNPIHVGAIFSDYDAMVDFSSWGPTASGRLKPNVVGPGCQLFVEDGIYSSVGTVSPRDNQAYDAYCGTSMSTPAVAGVVALLLQDYRAQYGTTDDPLNAAVKALLIHTAKDLGPPGPDYMYGYGRVDALAAASLLRRAAAGQPDSYFHDVLRHTPASVSQGDNHVFYVSVPANSAELKVSLAWDDPASSAPSTGVLTNDLDLEVRAPDSSIHLPFVLDPAQPWLTATRSVNNRDNEEQVVVTLPAPGTWAIHVKGTSVPQGPQTFGLVYSVAAATGDQVATPINYDPAVANGGFETTGSWTLTGGTGGATRVSDQSHSGSWSLRLGGANSRDDRAEQTHTIPADATAARLSYWFRMQTADNQSGADWMAVYVIPTDGSQQYIVDFYHNGTMKAADNTFETPRWAQVANIDLAPWAGKQIRILFRGTTGTSAITTFWIDDVRLEISTPVPCTAPNPPTNLQAVVPGDNRIDLSWTGVTCDSYRVYRATTSGGPYSLVASGLGSPDYSDTTVEAGVTYFYVVTAVNAPNCESGYSNQASATATGFCATPPSFGGLTSIAPLSADRCGLRLEWQAGSSPCTGGEPLVYNIYRSQSAGFTPGPSNLLASCVTANFFEDTSVAAVTTYHYVVRAEDALRSGNGACNGGNQDSNTAVLSGMAGAYVTQNLYPASGRQTFDTWTNGSMGDWSRGSFDGNSFDNWQGARACTPNSSSPNILRYGGLHQNQHCTRKYDINRHAFARPPAILVSANARAVLLDFFHRWLIATDGDGAYLRVSFDGTNFTYVPSAAFIQGGYNGLSGTTQVWNGNQNTSMTRTIVNLDVACNAIPGNTGGCAGNPVYVAFTFFSSGAGVNAGWNIDDVLITQEVPGDPCNPVPQPVLQFTARSISGENLLEWVNPGTGAYGGTVIRARTDTFPTGPTDGTAVTTRVGSPGAYDSFTHSGLTNTTTYYYAAFVDNGSGVHSAARTTTGRPFDTSGAVTWAYHTGATAVAPPGIRPGAIGAGAIYSFSNDRGLHAMNPTSAGGQWPRTSPYGWQPMTMNAPAQNRPGIVPTTVVPGASRVLFVGSQDGHVYAVNAQSGGVLWTSPDLGAMIQAAPTGMFTQFGGSWDLVFTPTRAGGADNKVVALNAATGMPAWTFDNGGGANGIGIIPSGATVDYATNRLYFTSRTRAGGSDHTVWALNFTGSGASLAWSRALGGIDAAPTLYAGRLYIGTNTGDVYALDPDSGATIWHFSTGGGAVKGFISPEFVTLPRRLTFSTTNTVWALTDAGGSASLLWREDAIPTPSGTLYIANQSLVVVGGGDGHLHSMRLADGTRVSVQLGSAAGFVGVPGHDITNGITHVGTEDGIVYAVTVPMPEGSPASSAGVPQVNPWPPGSWDGAALVPDCLDDTCSREHGGTVTQKHGEQPPGELHEHQVAIRRSR